MRRRTRTVNRIYMLTLCLVLAFLPFSLSKVYFHETFDETYDQRWVYSKDSSVTHGTFSRVHREHCSSEQYGIKSQNDSSYYHMSSKIKEVLDTTKSPLFLQYLVRYPSSMDCGGAYIKLFGSLDQEKLTGSTPYDIMVGPDTCGFSTKKVHVILSHKGQNYPLKNDVTFEIDNKLHLIELFLDDKKFHLKVDNQIKSEGPLENHFDYLAPKVIDDPNDKKPEDWVDEEMMDDPEDKKPEDWDDRQHIPDTEAKKPEDWDDANDGEWEPGLVENPAYKGEWKAKQIKNSAYKGEWKAKQIPNPAYKEDKTFAHYKIQFIGFDLWTVKSGTFFDDFFITDNKIEADKHAEDLMKEVEVVNAAVEKAEKEKTPETSVPPSETSEIPETSSETESESPAAEEEREDL